MEGCLQLPWHQVQMCLDHVARRAVSLETRVLPPQGSPLSPKKPGGLAGTCPRALTAPPACKASGGTEISLSQKQQIQQLRLLQETQICTGLISPGLYHHAKSRSYYALSGGQGPILSGVGEMIPQSPGWPEASFPQHSQCWAPHCPAQESCSQPGQTPSWVPRRPENPGPSRNGARFRPPL